MLTNMASEQNTQTELALNELLDRIYSQLDEKNTYSHIYGPVKSI